MRGDAERLDDILEAAAKIAARITDRAADFHQDEMLQVWVIHHLQVIGEAARFVSSTLRDRHPEVPWPEIIALRNILVHEYFGLNMDQVLTMAGKDVPELAQQIQRIRSEFAAGPGGGT